MSPAQASLRVWLLFVAGLRALSVVVALLWPEVLARSVFAAAPHELTPLGARVFACWTLTTCCLCVLCAKEGADPSTSTFTATAFSFVIALVLFAPELALHGTMTPSSAASPMAIAGVSLIWMAVVRWPRRRCCSTGGVCRGRIMSAAFPGSDLAPKRVCRPSLVL